MGFIREKYSNNRGGLVVAFLGDTATADYTPTDSVDAALAYFDMYLDNGTIMIRTEEEKALETTGITAASAESLREKLNSILPMLDDTTAIENTILFPLWESGQTYAVNDRIRYNGFLYKVLQAHTSQEDWTPNTAASLFARVLIEDSSVITDWIQPMATNGYATGDIVKHNNHTWRSLVNDNVWEPGTSGLVWENIDETPASTIAEWVSGQLYNANDVVSYNGEIWISLYDNNGNPPAEGWWRRQVNENEATIADYVAGTTYNTGDQVLFEGRTYESLIDNNVWSPTAYPQGWQLIGDET